MRFSEAFIPTLKEAPADAEVVSHKLLLRAGLVRQLTSGVYSYMPLGLRSLNKVANIVREEMNRAGAQEVFLPMVQPADLWQETGRWEVYGKELLRFKDRHDRDCCLGPTHEEVITKVVRDEIKSYRQLPFNLYQIQTKFRDEIRPRFGLMRGREFMMKDAYSFDRDDAGASKSYQAMYEAYKRIFSRLGLNFRPVEADSGSIGGNFSHEFMVLASTGEDTIAACADCDFASNIERAKVMYKGGKSAEHALLWFKADERIVAVAVRPGREVNDIKVKNYLDSKVVASITEEQAKAAAGAEVVRLADNEVDLPGVPNADLRFIAEGDPCPVCGGKLNFPEGIEVGHVFKLGTKYSESMKACYTDESGHDQFIIMGCYGIGVSRVVAAAIEQNHDDGGIIFPPPLAPYEVALLNLDPKNEEVKTKTEALYAALNAAGIETLMDDRDERPGVKFKDADLIGFPIQIVVGGKSLARGVVEVKDRRTGERGELPADGFMAAFDGWREKVLSGWKNRRYNTFTAQSKTH